MTNYYSVLLEKAGVLIQYSTEAILTIAALIAISKICIKAFNITHHPYDKIKH